MSGNFAYIDIILFAMVAAFIALRLRSVLGKKTGQERRRPSGVEAARPAGREAGAKPVTGPMPIETEGRVADPRDEGVKQGLAAIRLADPGFDLDGFLGGAKSAFTMIIEAFARGDRDALKPLLADDVFRGFDAVIAEREDKGETHELQIVAVPTAEVAGAVMRGRVARVGVRFVSQQVGVFKDKDGAVIDGDPSEVAEVEDVWTFERDTANADPNWELVETRSPA